MYTVASPDPYPRGGGQLPNHNECNSTLTSGTKNIYPSPIDVNDRGHRLRSGSPVTICEALRRCHIPLPPFKLVCLCSSLHRNRLLQKELDSLKKNLNFYLPFGKRI